MLSKELYLELHSVYYDLFLEQAGPDGPYVSYEMHEIPSNLAEGGGWFIFHGMAKDLIREMKNDINGFKTNIRRLCAWAVVTENCPEDHRYSFVKEIVEPLAILTLNGPYATKQRFSYVGNMLLHQGKMLVDPSWKENNLVESKINLKTFKLFESDFQNVGKLVEAIKRIDDLDFRTATGEFRPLFHHRVPRKLEIGLSRVINRMVDSNGRTSYGFGGQQPIKISDCLPPLKVQHQAYLYAFDSLWDMVCELVDIWKRERPGAET